MEQGRSRRAQARLWLVLWLPVLAWMGLIFYLSSQPDFPLPDTGWFDLVISSGAHAFVFGVLALLLARALGDRPYAWLAAFGLAMLYALSDEFHQTFVPGRVADPWDLLFDALGAAAGVGLWAWWQRARR